MGWTQVPSGGIRQIPADLEYGQTYYVCVHATNVYDSTSDEPAVTDGITILDPLGDPDGDGFVSQDELTAKSHPLDFNSIPGDSIIRLREGFNLIVFPGETLFYNSFGEVLEVMGGSNVINRVLVFDPENQNYREAGYDGEGRFYGAEIALQDAMKPMGMIVYAKTAHTADLTSRYCGTWQVQPGVNLTGTGCNNTAAMTAFDLLPALSPEPATTSIQRYNAVDGAFETAAIDADGSVSGVNFSIIPGEGYFVFLNH